MNRVVVRIFVVLTVVFGADYVVWRWLVSVNWSVWWIAVPLVLAETHSVVDAFLFGRATWRAGEHGEPAPPDLTATVDVFVRTNGEPVDQVLTTARAATRIAFPHKTWILDDDARPELRAAAAVIQTGYITRPDVRAEQPRNATASLNHALSATEGEFLLVLDVDQVPEPTILDRTLGYFRDLDVAIVQTPHFPDGAGRLGRRAPKIAGSIPKSENTTSFCGSNAVLRREALLQLGIAGYVRQVERTVRRVLRTSETVLRKAREEARQHGPGVLAALDQVEAAVDDACREVRAGGRRTSIMEITHRFRRRVDTASRGLVDADVVALHADLAEMESFGGRPARPVAPLLESGSLAWLSRQEMSPLRAMASVRALVDALDVARSHDAQSISPTATLPVSDDRATVLRLHAMGWKSAEHHERLTYGRAPADLSAVLRRRMRRTRGTLPVMLTESLLTRGLSAGQRLTYFATMWRYLSGSFALAYIAAPVFFLCFDVRPMTSYGPDFLIRVVPYLVLNPLLVVVIGDGRPGTRYRRALLPLWIGAIWTPVVDVVVHRPTRVRTRTARQQRPRPAWRLIWPQTAAMALLVASATVGAWRFLAGSADYDLLSLAVNLAWILVDLVILFVGLIAVERTRRPAR